jgi:hypothetical protein
MKKFVKVDPEEVDQFEIEEVLNEVWRDVKSDPELRQELDAAGCDLSQIEKSEEMFLDLEPTEQGFSGVEIFLITLAAGVATHFTSAALEVLWKKAIWPALEARFGTSVNEAGGGSDAGT